MKEEETVAINDETESEEIREFGRVLTMADIAALAGVAESTVSRALADSNRVSAKTKERIRAIVTSHGYRINERARALRTQTSRTIEVVVPSSKSNKPRFSDLFVTELVSELADVLSERNYDMLLSRVPPWSEGFSADAVAAGRADGVIVIGQGDQNDEIERLAKAKYPIIVWGGQAQDQSYCTVGTDNVLGGWLVGKHLSDLGRRSVAFLGDIRFPEIFQRHQGCLQALRGENHDTDHLLTLATPFDAPSAYRATCEIIERGNAHDAIFAASDVIAIAAVQALQDVKIRVPEDIAVVGYDDISVSAFVSPALTTIRQDIPAGAVMLIEKMMQTIGGDPPKSEVLPTKLIVRRSCGGAIDPDLNSLLDR